MIVIKEGGARNLCMGGKNMYQKVYINYLFAKKIYKMCVRVNVA